MQCTEPLRADATPAGKEGGMEIWAKLIPELLVTDIDESLHFWRDLIGFSVAYDRPEDRFTFLELDGAQIKLEQQAPAERQWIAARLDAPFGRGVNFQIEVSALQPILERLAAASWPLFMEPEDAWYRSNQIEVGQRQCVVQDPDGYLLRLAQDIGERAAG